MFGLKHQTLNHYKGRGVAGIRPTFVAGEGLTFAAFAFAIDFRPFWLAFIQIRPAFCMETDRFGHEFVRAGRKIAC
jgi:hypothetical protein